MKRNKLWPLTVLFSLLVAVGAVAQKTTANKPAAPNSTAEKKQQADAVADEKKVRDMVAFLEYMLNTLGNSSTPFRDKEVLITESYSKIFRDSKVQVEDDLDEERHVITNKDVVAYLKDVNFFFSNVRFEFSIEDIHSSTMANGQHFYKVAVRRTLMGTTSDQKAINNTMPRYIEINYNPKDQDLKIVSIYTHEFDEKAALTGWWNELSFEWQSVFRKKLLSVSQSRDVRDSVSLSGIKQITSIEELDLTGNTYIQDIRPLAQLQSLKSLNLSKTIVTDLVPLRNLTELRELNISYTKIKDLSPLRYSNKLEKLDVSYTDISNISVLERMPELQDLAMTGTWVSDFMPIAGLTRLTKADFSATKISDLSPLENLEQLKELDVSQTLIQDLGPIGRLKNLERLNIDSTRVRNIPALSNLEKLNVLSANHTMIHDLDPLQKLRHLEKIYCDQTPVTREIANAFLAASPKVLVIFDSKDLSVWWETLSREWRDILAQASKITTGKMISGQPPAREELAKVTSLDSINFSGQAGIRDLEPLRKLPKLQVIIASKTSVNDLTPLQDHREITHIDISDTEVSDLSVIGRFTKLRVLRADNSKIENIERFVMPNLEKFYADQTSVHDIIAQEFLEKNPTCLLVYKTAHLERWWAGLSESWKEVFRSGLSEKKSGLTREDLHRIVESEALRFKDAPVSGLSVLNEFVRLKELHFSGTAITAIPPLENLKSLKSFHATNSPLRQIEALGRFTELEDLDISNTPIDDLSPIWRLKKLKSLNCSGTQIKRLNALEKLESLEHLDCSNTNVSRLDPLNYLNLKTLKCYNTKVSNRAIENFIASHPECRVVYYR